jgi:hypothetical protein
VGVTGMKKIISLIIAALACLAFLVMPAAASASVLPAGSVTLPGLDLHDGMILKTGGLYYHYGTMYSCGNPAGSKLYEWGKAGSPWCGFGYSTSRSLAGPWAPVQVLLSRWALDNWGPDKGKSWNAVCGGSGCFEPRMMQRSDGVWILWFTAVADWSQHGNGPSYYALGCNGPAGGCGYQAGGPHGSTHKPLLHQCADTDDDPAFLQQGSSMYLYCSLGGTLSVEELASNWTNGSGVGATDILPGLAVEATGEWSPSAGEYEMTYSAPRCGYCSGTRSAAGPVRVNAGWATASSPLGPWTARGAWGIPDGQPNTVIDFGVSVMEYLDDWTGALNETKATVQLLPLPGPWGFAPASTGKAAPAGMDVP